MTSAPQLPELVISQSLTIQRMAEALKLGFDLDPELSKAIRTDQKASSPEQAITSWVIKLLIVPDQYFGESLMPVVTLRFQEYLDNLRSARKWKH